LTGFVKSCEARKMRRADFGRRSSDVGLVMADMVARVFAVARRAKPLFWTLEDWDGAARWAKIDGAGVSGSGG